MTSKLTISCKPLLICVTEGSATLELAAISDNLCRPSANCPLKVLVIEDAELIVSCETMKLQIEYPNMTNQTFETSRLSQGKRPL